MTFESPLRLADPTAPRRRLKLWEIEHGYHCSIVGTCLTPATARQILRRARVEIEGGAEDYRLHSLLVSEATRQGVIGRLINKTLDDSFAGPIRRVAATQGEGPQAALWDELCAKGEVAAGYWAFLSHGHVAADLRLRIFGEVHMLSHFMGGHHRGNAKALWLAERRAEQLAERLARSRRQAQETVSDRDQRIAVLEAELARTRDELARRVARVVRDHRPAGARRTADPARLERRILATRAQLRQVESDNARLRRLLDILADEVGPAAPQPRPEARAPPDGCAAGRCLLYVGGRCSLVPHLRRHAEARRVELLHHDGGDEEGMHVLERLIGRADAVFCPIDCVSHQTCLAAKQLCRRLDKTFVPLRTGSGTCFLRAVDRWRGAQ
jgi:hypothetical protein